jgi:Flp pilus assembly protein TadG
MSGAVTEAGERRRGTMLRRCARARRGASAVEFALVLPACLMLLFGVMEGGRALWLQNALNYAVEQAARCAAIDTNNCGSANQVQAYASTISGSDFPSADFAVATAACGNVVSASYPVQLHIPFVAAALTLTAQSCYP